MKTTRHLLEGIKMVALLAASNRPNRTVLHICLS